MSAVTPITPLEAETVVRTDVPDFVLEAFNTLIHKSYRHGTSTVKQKEVIELIMKLVPGLDRQEIFSNHWLDIETVYEKSGWKVHYDRPGYNESYDPTFEFLKK